LVRTSITTSRIVDAQRCPGDWQPPGSLTSRCGPGLFRPGPIAADGWYHSVDAGCGQQRGTDPVRGVAEGAGEASADQETEDRHTVSKIPKITPTSRPCTRINAADPDAH